MILPLQSDGFFKYLSYEALTDVTSRVLLEHSTAISIILGGIKAFAAAFILLYWIKSFVEGIKDPEKGKGISFYNIAVGIAYIALVFNFNVISDGLDQMLGMYEKSFNVSAENQMYSISNEWMEQYQEDVIAEEEHSIGFWDSTVSGVKAVMNALNGFTGFSIILGILKLIAWFVNVIVFPIFVLERGFLLLILKVAMPLILALGAIEVYRELVWKWIRIYIAVFLTGLFLILATQFCDMAFGMLTTTFDIKTAANSKTMLFIVIAFAKVKLYKSSFEISYKIFNA